MDEMKEQQEEVAYFPDVRTWELEGMELDDDDEDHTKTLITCRLPLPNTNREDHKCFWDFVLKEEGANDGIRRPQPCNLRSTSLNLTLNYQKVLDAWSDRGSLWADFNNNNNSLSNNYTSSAPPPRGYMGEVPVLMECTSRGGRKREDSVLRYKEKRHSRLFAKKIRYQVRKLNADQRPRLKVREKEFGEDIYLMGPS